MNTFLESIHILGVRVTTSPKEEILKYIQTYLQLSNTKRKPLVIVTPNPEQIVLAHKDKHFAAMFNSADVAIPDGIGLVVAMRFFFRLPTTNYPSTSSGSRVEPRDQLPATKRIPGVEFMEDLVAMATRNGWPVALIGGRGGVAEEALLRLKKKYLGLTGWVEEPGAIINTTPAKRDPRCCNPNKNWEQHRDNTTNDQFYQYTQKIIDKIKKTHTKLVFVGLGAPKQEYLIEAVSRQFSVIRQSEDGRLTTDDSLVLMSVGGSFDFIAGRVARAPIFVRSMGLEWLWRLVREPWRWKRQLALLKFLWLVVGGKLASKGLTL